MKKFIKIIYLQSLEVVNKAVNTLSTCVHKLVDKNPALRQSFVNILALCIPCNYRACGAVLTMLTLLTVKKGHPRKVSQRGLE